MSLFNRPAWAESNTNNDDDDDDDGGEVDMFRHAEKDFTSAMAEEQRRRKEKAEREKAKAERKKIKAERRSSGKHKREDDNDDGTLKKRRITLEDSKKLLGSIGISVDNPSGAGSDDEPEAEVGPVRRSSRKNKQNRSAHSQPQSQSRNRTDVVEINDDGDDDEPVIQHVASVKGSEEGEDDDDDDFAELRRQARLQREQKETKNRLSGASNGAAQDSSQYNPPEDEPIVQLFIDSPIENTKALLVQRKLSQDLGVVLKAWIGKQGFSKDFDTSKIFFIHRMRRLYRVTTCKSIGLEVNAFGELTMKGAEGKEGLEKVHLQAVTEEIYQKILAEKEAEAKRRSGELAEEQAGGGAEDEEVVKEESSIRVILRAKNLKDLPLKVKPSTPISKIGDAFRRSRLSNDQSKQVRLEFDGDPLDPDDEVQSTEIEDMNVLDVYIT